ncbi:MAG: ABC transporter substrate-binding protein [Roseburia sp.]|nr:ABC transporter substrate-binding protein [Anaeroplasma bactoclasticum]MCM1195460.1 ABC transporter substrate-binding protein [Roseburia sp.]MCM1555939.1 ABC transporter substrate-binding protein [Anaeroplasma bactoclasticum]
MKGKFKKFGIAALALLGVVSLASCGKKAPNFVDFEVPTDASEFKKYALLELNDSKDACRPDTLDAATQSALSEVYQKYGKKISDAANDDYAKIYSLTKEAKTEMYNTIPYANGLISYAKESNAVKTDILGALEKYAVENGITGLTLYENGNYSMYNERITLGTENYISGYGFGTLAEGDITADLASEENSAWKRYYHTLEQEDPGTANYLNSDNSLVSDYYGYIGASFFTTFMNETKDGYDWVPELANELPTAVNPDESGMATKWKFPVKVGTELKYNTLSTDPSRSAFNNREVKLEDYETAFKLLLTKKNGYFRGSELAAQKAGSGQLVGAKAYYDASENGYNATEWEKVGIKTYVEDGQSWFEYEFTTAYAPFYAMYYINSSLYMPVPQEFLDLVTPEFYLGYNNSGTLSPVDNSLSLGAYTLERWDADQQVVYKKNPNYVYANEKYKVPGIHLRIFPASASDRNAAFREFLAGHIDGCGIPMDYLDEYKSDPRTRTTLGDSNFKLNINACSQETWVELFGVNGLVTQTPESKYWQCEPALSNPYFVKALSLSLNRKEYAENRGVVASCSYLSSNYMSDPENGLSYSVTDAHKDAILSLTEGTDGFGYNLQQAREYFKLALTQLELDGKYTPGTKENPTVISLEIAWMRPSQEESSHNDVAKYFMDAFNDDSVSDGKYRLEITFWASATSNLDVYYEKLMPGQYDLGFGSISGNSLNPLDFVSVLSSDQSISGNFTLNWGQNTNDPDSNILVYDGVRWSYDALWTAGMSTALVIDGALSPIVSPKIVTHTKNADGSYSVSIEVAVLSGDGYSAELTDVVLFWADYETAADYFEESILDLCTKTTDGNKTIYTFIIPAAKVEEYKGNIGYDIYYNSLINGVEEKDNISTVTSKFE